VRLFRRKPLHERLLAAGERDVAPPDVRPVVGGGRETGIHGIARQREWDAVATVVAPEVRGDELRFDVLPDGIVLVEQEEGDASLGPLADAIERELRPPYRAQAVRQSGELWAVAARAIEVVRLPPREGERIELAFRQEERSLTVDGFREFGTVHELEALAARSGHAEYVVRAERLDGDWWEVVVDPL
jgi:hypothetical protein